MIYRRLTKFLVGFSLGIILVFYILNKKGTSCNYFPNQRVISNILSKEKKFFISEPVRFQLKELSIDSSNIMASIKNGKVDFSESSINKDNCNIYSVGIEILENKYSVQIQNCDSTATLSKFEQRIK